MPRRKRPPTSQRKAPVQARSTQMVADILQAAVRVLSREGAERFTTIRVAEAAGVSVGSLYQYFPNKQSILFRLQVDEWEQTGAMVDSMLADTSKSPAERLRTMIRAFFQSECDEAPLRLALDAAAPNYHESAEALTGRKRSERVVKDFVRAAAPRANPRQRQFAAELLFMTISAIGKQLSERSPSAPEVHRWADAVSSMLMAHLESLGV